MENEEITGQWATVHGPGLVGFGPFGGPPGYSIEDPDKDVIIDHETGMLTIVVAPRVTAKGVTVAKVVHYPRGAWTNVTTSTTTKEA